MESNSEMHRDAYVCGGVCGEAVAAFPRGMDMAEVADVVGMDEDDIEENFGELIAWQKTVL